MDKELLAYYADLLSLYAQIEGMKAENMNRQRRGESMAYSDSDFLKVQGSIDYIGMQIRQT